MANIQTFTGDGTTVSFYFTFPFFGTNDINVSINNVVQTAANFALYPTPTSGDAPDIPYTGGRIDFAAAPANGATIKIWRDVDINRHIDYQPTNQPQSHQLNQDINQCIEILKEQSEKLTNVLGLASIPNVADLLDELTTIRAALPTFVTDDDLTDITTAITTLNGYDYVVASQSPTADNDYTWYRKYKSGWIEQGGITASTIISAGYSVDKTVTFPVTMADTNYTATFGLTSGHFGSIRMTRNTTGGTITLYNRSNNGDSSFQAMWFISGMAAE